MLDISFSKMILVFLISLVVLGPKRLPVVVRRIAGWIRELHLLATNVQNELAQEFKIQEPQDDSLEKIKKKNKNSPATELKATTEELKETNNLIKLSENPVPTVINIISRSPLVKNLQDSYEDLTSLEAMHQIGSQKQAIELESTRSDSVKYGS